MAIAKSSYDYINDIESVLESAKKHLSKAGFEYLLDSISMILAD